MTPTLISTSANAMSRFTPEERDCYSEKEISLKYLPASHGYRYEMSNCLFESAFENILKECKCYPGKSKKPKRFGSMFVLLRNSIFPADEICLGWDFHVEISSMNQTIVGLEKPILKILLQSNVLKHNPLFIQRKK